MNDEPQPPADEPTDPQPDEPETAPTAVQEAPRRLMRSRDDRVIAGVAGGLGRYFNVDPVIFRIAFAASLLIGGLGGLLYLAAWVFIPEERRRRHSRPPRRASAAARSRRSPSSRSSWSSGRCCWRPCCSLLGAGLVAGLLVLPLAAIALVGFLVWWLVTGERPVGSARDVRDRGGARCRAARCCAA